MDSSGRRPTDMSAHEQSQPVTTEESQHAHQQLISEREAETGRKQRDWCTHEDQVLQEAGRAEQSRSVCCSNLRKCSNKNNRGTRPACTGLPKHRVTTSKSGCTYYRSCVRFCSLPVFLCFLFFFSLTVSDTRAPVTWLQPWKQHNNTFQRLQTSSKSSRVSLKGGWLHHAPQHKMIEVLESY